MITKTFIITGATGFLGNNIIRELIKEKDIEIRALVLPNTSLKAIEGLAVKLFYGDVVNFSSLEKLFVDTKGEIYLIHTASIVSVKTAYSRKVYDVNVEGVKNIADLALKHNAKLIYISSVHALEEKRKGEIVQEVDNYDIKKVYGHYAKSKVLASNYILSQVKEKGLKASIILPSGMLGPNDYGNGHISQLFIDYASNKLKAIVNGGYDFCDVRDVARGIINACYFAKIGESYILSNQYFKIKEILEEAKKILNKKRKIIILPMSIAKITAPLAELYYVLRKKPPLYTKFSLKTVEQKVVFSHQKAIDELNYKCRDIKESIEDTIAFLIKEKRIEIKD